MSETFRNVPIMMTGQPTDLRSASGAPRSAVVVLYIDRSHAPRGAASPGPGPRGARAARAAAASKGRGGGARRRVHARRLRFIYRLATPCPWLARACPCAGVGRGITAYSPYTTHGDKAVRL